jgi:uracil-DNA glycosylase family 4
MSEKPSTKNYLKWKIESGQNECLAELPENRFLNHANSLENLQISIAKKTIPQTESAPSSVQSASEFTEMAKTISELRTTLENFEGCSLKNTAMNLVFGDGNKNADIMLIGEAPGADEDREGKPFAGLSGQLLDKMICSIGLERQNIYIANIIPWRPPGNRQPTPSEIAICLPFIKRHIELIDPKVLILVGGTSAKTLLEKKEGIMRLRGRWFNYQTNNDKTLIPALPILHPAFLLHSPSQKSNAWKDLISVRKKLLNLGVIF